MNVDSVNKGLLLRAVRNRLHSFAFVKNPSASTAQRQSDLNMWKPANELKVMMMTVVGGVLRPLILAEALLHPCLKSIIASWKNSITDMKMKILPHMAETV